VSKHEPRCQRITTEEWKVHPTSPGAPNGQVRTMRARCVLGVGHVLSEHDNEARHIYGDWLEVGK
jgi:hypothetical protein